MTLGQWVLRHLYPSHEAQRMELRRAISQSQACAEDIGRSARAIKSSMNGHKRSLSVNKSIEVDATAET